MALRESCWMSPDCGRWDGTRRPRSPTGSRGLTAIFSLTRRQPRLPQRLDAAILPAPADRAVLAHSMNVLFVLYGGLDSNSAIPLALHARELHRRGHRCAVAVPVSAAPALTPPDLALRVLPYKEALADPTA